MKHVGFAGILLVVISVGAGQALAQRSVKRSSAKTTAASKNTIPPLEVRVAREKVSNQLDNINRFVDLLGPIAQGIETLDESARSKPLSASARDRNETNKKNVVAAIRNLRAGLSDLESDFRTKPALQKYRSGIEGITELAAQAEDTALAGRFVASKEPLRTAALKLNDTLKLMPIGPVARIY
jgi:uncharacterized phage infection (PIP) family protein YhgE